jgi:hypothetical protein
VTASKPGYQGRRRQLRPIVEDRLRDLEWANNVSFKPADWTFMERVQPQAGAYPGAVHQDFQVGEVIRASETEAGYGYSPEIFRASPPHD